MKINPLLKIADFGQSIYGFLPEPDHVGGHLKGD